jgi:DNA repair photolyase
MHGAQEAPHGRGAASNPPNRFTPHWHVRDPDWTDPEDPAPSTRFLKDTARAILTSNASPDVGFTYSINPYRGCEHGCIYCYARPTHAYLGFSAGLDFETQILVKHDAPELLRHALAASRWHPQVLAMSGVTDPYQPIERRLLLTRPCLEVLAECRNPVVIVTKSALYAGYVTLRLPHGVATLFEDWLHQHAPTKQAKILQRIRALRGGQLNDARFGVRMQGEGVFADHIAALFTLGCRKAGLQHRDLWLSTAAFRRPTGVQLSLFS